MKLKHIPTSAMICSFFLLLITQAHAEIVAIKPDSCGAAVTSTGQFQEPLSSPSFVFTKISLGHACGSIQGRFLRGESGSNALPAGTTCVIRATLQNSSGAVVAGRSITVRDNTGRLMARGKTHANGAVRFRFRNRSARTSAFVLVGPPIEASNVRLGCFVYTDHCSFIAPTGVHANAC